MVVPFVNEHVPQGQSKVQLCHAGVQVVPKHCVLKEKLSRLCIRQPFQGKEFGKVTPADVVRGMACVLKLDWMALYRPYNLDAFEYLMNGFKRSQLIRISPYKADTADTTG